MDTEFRKHSNQGFTMAELLVVVAIIAVLVVIAIPVFTSQLEKSREATDLANVRSAYAEVMTEANTDASSQSSSTYSRAVSLKQQADDWQTAGDITIGGITHKQGEGDTAHWKGVPAANGTCTVSYSVASGVVIEWKSSSSTPGGGLSPTSSHYFTQLKTEYLDSISDRIPDYVDEHGFFIGYLIQKDNGTTEFVANNKDSSITLQDWPPNAVAGVISQNGTQCAFFNEDWSEQYVWDIGGDWMPE